MLGDNLTLHSSIQTLIPSMKMWWWWQDHDPGLLWVINFELLKQILQENVKVSIWELKQHKLFYWRMVEAEEM